MNGEIRSVFGSWRCIRINNTVVTGGAGKTLTVKFVYTTGRMAGSAGGTNIFTGGTFTSPILLPDGTTTAPSLAFASESNTGIYRAGGATVDISVSWVRRYAFSTSLFYLLNDLARIGLGASTDVILTRDAAATLALRNSTNAQTFNIYNTYTDGSNYERIQLGWDTNVFYLRTQSAGSGSVRSMAISSPQVQINGVLVPSANDAGTIGTGSPWFWQSAYLSRSIQGFKTNTITHASATAFVRLALPQTIALNTTGGSILWRVHCDNNSTTTYADRTGETVFSCNNIAGTEACVFDATAQQVTQAATYSLAAPTFTATGGTDTVDININADCGGVVGPTNMYINYRLNILDPQTITPL